MDRKHLPDVNVFGIHNEWKGKGTTGKNNK